MDNLSKRRKRKANIWITVIFAAAIFVVFNIMLKTLAQKVQLSFDMTPNKLFVLSDEIYAELTYGGNHVSFASLPGMKERTITINGFSKSHAMTGWRLGQVRGAEPVMNNIKKIHDFTVVGAASPLQETALTALNFGDDYYQELQAHYTHMKEIFTGGLRNLGFKFTEPQGTYFVMMDISEFGYKSDDQFCIDLAQKVGVAAVPGSSFFREPVNHLIRFHFAKKDETLYDALNRLESLRKKLKL